MTITTRKYKSTHNRIWFEKIMAILALINLILVFFDLTYIPLRDFWLQGRLQVFVKLGTLEYEIPNPPLKVLPFNITPYYDLVKGIEPERFTSDYLQTVAELRQLLEENEVNPAPENIVRIDTLLADLREKSEQMIANDPFSAANKTGTLERIKRKMRLHIFGNKQASATQSFNIFWSRSHLLTNHQQELDFFYEQIEPLIATNYFRPVGETGQPVDNFGLIDFPFGLIFFAEFLLRTLIISRRYTGVNWLDAMLWRWYDVFLFLPVFRTLRVIPVIIRLSQAKLLDLRRVQRQVSQGFVANIAGDITEVVVIQIINQLQNSVRRGELANFISQYNDQQYIDLNDIDETKEIVKLVSNLMVREVLPKLETDIEALFQHILGQGLKESPAWQSIAKLPGAEQVNKGISEQIAKQVYQNVYNVLFVIVEEDPVYDQILEKLLKDFRKIMTSEMQAQKSMKKIEYLITALLEEVKVNYVERLAEDNIEDILEQKRALLQTIKEVNYDR
ncbi:MAG: hypothetical protein EA365_08115 [Gloeocapsa sp. DLM2.Bin57]|nr:MAG: hypothetical protein EA365_08115 [Gloeocapsa sp. DLM2.Bin57]